MSTVYLIPSLLAEDGLDSISPLTVPLLRSCGVVFAENLRTARRFIKQLDRDFVIDNLEWFEIDKAEGPLLRDFEARVKAGKDIAVISEAGCPGIADPGALLVAKAHQLGCTVKPITGPNSMLLALMASGLNGQRFEFVGYLPVDSFEREKKIRELEATSVKNNSTQIFMETPYRNRPVLDSLLKVCSGSTRLCVAKNITGSNELIRTLPVSEWKKNTPAIGKEPCVFLLNGAEQK